MSASMKGVVVALLLMARDWAKSAALRGERGGEDEVGDKYEIGNLLVSFAGRVLCVRARSDDMDDVDCLMFKIATSTALMRPNI